MSFFPRTVAQWCSVFGEQQSTDVDSSKDRSPLMFCLQSQSTDVVSSKDSSPVVFFVAETAFELCSSFQSRDSSPVTFVFAQAAVRRRPVGLRRGPWCAFCSAAGMQALPWATARADGKTPRARAIRGEPRYPLLLGASWKSTGYHQIAPRTSTSPSFEV